MKKLTSKKFERDNFYGYARYMNNYTDHIIQDGYGWMEHPKTGKEMRTYKVKDRFGSNLRISPKTLFTGTLAECKKFVISEFQKGKTSYKDYEVKKQGEADCRECKQPITDFSKVECKKANELNGNYGTDEVVVFFHPECWKKTPASAKDFYK